MAEFAKPIKDLTKRDVAAVPSAGKGLALDHVALAPVNALGTGTASTSTFLRGDRTWAIPPAGGGGAPATATYITQIPDATLSAEQALSLLATGILKSTTGTGVVSIAVAADLPAHAVNHKSGGSDVIALDTLGGTSDITTLNSTVLGHGLLPKLDGNAAHWLDGTGAWTAVTAAAATFNPNLYISTSDATIPANSTIVITDFYEVGSGFMLDIADAGSMNLIL